MNNYEGGGLKNSLFLDNFEAC